jgi:hypothetical protein
MANRFPLIVDSSALQIKEIPANDNLDLANNSIVNVVDITASGNVTIGGTLTYEDVKNVDALGIVTARTGIKVLAGGIDAVGVVTATTFSGSGANLTNLPSAQLSGALPAIDGSQLQGIISGVGIATAGGYVGSGATTLKFIGAGVSAITAPSAGVSTIHITGGGGGGGGGGSISTEAATPSNAVVTLDLTAAQDHKVTATGICTITCSGGAEGESHTVRIINAASATIGFSTYFLFPSGSTPSIPSGTGAISLISFTVNREGAAGISTQLLAGASVNFS